MNEINEMTEIIKTVLLGQHICADVESRIKSVNSINQKVRRKNILHTQITDKLGIRVIVKTKEECYEVMKLITKEFKPILGKLKDYIQIPKENGYQSIHLVVEHKTGPIEIQIRTEEMHKAATHGKAIYYKD